MEFLSAYAFFALTTSIASLIILVGPVIEELKSVKPDSPILDSPFITYTTFMVLSLLIAPIIFIACIFPSSNEKFKIGLLNSLKD